MTRPWRPCLVLTCLLAAGPAAAEAPLRLEVEPNALQRLKDDTLPPMDIEVRGLAEGETVFFEVLRDCDNDGIPERQGRAACKSPVKRWQSPPADARGLRTELDFESLVPALPKDAPNVHLWLRASRTEDGEDAELAPFGLVRDACGLWESLVDVFFNGECDPGLLQALRRHKGPAGLEDVTFEVRRLAVASHEPADEPAQVPGTLGATGLDWVDASTLLVTRSPVFLEVPAVLKKDELASEVPPGLYRLRIRDAPDDATEDATQEESELLWKPTKDDKLMPAAPFALADGRIVFVRQSLFGDPDVDEAAAVFLVLLEDRKVTAEIPLPYRVHQVLAQSEDGKELLALTLGVRSNRPLLLRVNLEEKAADIVGYHHGLYHAAMRSPDGKTAAISMDDASGRWGWELVLVDEKGEWVADLVHRKDLHDLMAAWRPGGGELAYLAEVSRIVRRSR